MIFFYICVMETATQELNYLKGNELIHIFMGWEYTTPEEKMNYLVSPNSLRKQDPVEFCKKHPNLPELKKKGAVITTLSMDDIRYTDQLEYHCSLDSLIPVMEKIRDKWLKNGIEGREDLMYTMQYLLGAGFKFGSLESLPKLNFSVENLHRRIVMMLNYYNVK